MLLARDLARQLDPTLLAREIGFECDPWQAKLLREQPKRCLLNASRQSGKSTTCGLLALVTAISEPGALIVVLSPSQRQSNEFVRSVRMMHQRAEGVVGLKGDSVTKIEFENDARILALPGDNEGDKIRGLANCRLMLIDEASRVSDGLLQAARPMLATNRNGALVALTTPAGKRGWFYEAWISGDPTWTRIEVPASACPRISAEFLAEELKALGPSRYAEEYGLQFVDQEDSAFATDLIDGAVNKDLVPIWL